MTESRRVYLDFVGCRLNQAEIEQIGRQFAAQGDALTTDAAEADLVVINTCAVTKEAARKSRQIIRRSTRDNPDVRIVATGCYAELSPDKVASLPNVDHVIGTLEKDQLVALITPQAPVYETEPLLRQSLPPGTLGRTRAFVKVQDGCDNRCTFCITTVARGAGRSRPVQEIIAEINLLVDTSYHEVVLTGVHLGSYGHDQGQTDGLYTLVQAILRETAVPRLRLSSLEPWDLSEQFFDLWHNQRLCPHLHLPLQAGSDRILRRMARRTTQEAFRTLVESARKQIPDLAITTDIIVGFPGESDAEFEESLGYVEKTGFARLHVFKYSMRAGTPAAQMSGHIPTQVKKSRQAQMQSLSDQLWTAYQRQQVGRTYDVLWESARGATPDGLIWAGHTPNYVHVYTTTPQTLSNTITPAQIVEYSTQGLRAEALI